MRRWIQESGRGRESGKGKGKGPADKRSANPSARSSSKEKQSATPSDEKGARKRPGESTSLPPRRPAAPAPTQLQPSEEIFFCCSCLSNRTTSHPTKNPRQGRGNQPNDQCVDCGHKMCKGKCVVQKAGEHTGEWIMGIAAKKTSFSAIPWGPQPEKLWSYSSFQHLEYECYPYFFCCHCMRRGDPLFNLPVNTSTKKTSRLRCYRTKKSVEGQCGHGPCNRCSAQPWSKEDLARLPHTPPQAQLGPPSYVPQRQPNDRVAYSHQAGYSRPPPNQTNQSTPYSRQAAPSYQLPVQTNQFSLSAPQTVSPYLAPPPNVPTTSHSQLKRGWTCKDCEDTYPDYAIASCMEADTCYRCGHNASICGQHCKKWLFEPDPTIPFYPTKE